MAEETSSCCSRHVGCRTSQREPQSFHSRGDGLREGVEVVVAPYEADSQLAYLAKEGIADVVITEDSDLLAFGCKQVT